MNAAIRTLEQSGYRQFYLAFGDANFRKHDWARAAPALPSPLSDLVRLFLLQQSVARKKLQALLGQAFIQELLASGVLREQHANLLSDSFFLIFCRGYALFCQMVLHPLAYFGDDSVALAAYQTPAFGGKVLDLCCGTGIQGFVAAGTAAEVTAVEIQKETCRIAELNRRLNNLQGRVKLVCSSAEEFAQTNTDEYDRILFNPPLVPMPAGYRFPLAGNGGPDGLSVTRRIIALYGRRLSARGSMEFVGTGLGSQSRPLVCDQLRMLARRFGLQGRVQLLSHHPIRAFAPVFESSVSVFAADNRLDATEAREKLLAHFRKLRQDTYWMFFASLRPAIGRSKKELCVVDLTKSFWGSWFV